MKAWVYLTPKGGINFRGNGAHWQLPIFPTKKEGIQWAKDWANDPRRIKPVIVKITKK